jgi:hypothetical protein
LARYFWHTCYLFAGRGSAARFRAQGEGGIRLLWFVLRAHLAVIAHAPRLWGERRQIRARARVTPRVFRRLLASHSMSARRIARL